MAQFISEVERTYGFRDPAFAEYMSVRSRNGLPPQEFMHLSEGMSRSDHPIVQCAAGWAAMEACTAGRDNAQRHEWSFSNRIQALTVAETAWRWISPESWAGALPEGSLEAASLWGISQRVQRALAYIPAFQLVARHIDGQTLHRRDIRDTFMAVKDTLSTHTITLLRKLRVPADNPQGQISSGLANELAAAWLLQPELMRRVTARTKRSKEPEATHVIIPASFRDNNHVSPGVRADLLAVSLGENASKRPITVSSFGESRPISGLAVFDMKEDAPSGAGGVILQQVMAAERGGDAEARESVTALSARWVNKLLSGWQQ